MKGFKKFKNEFASFEEGKSRVYCELNSQFREGSRTMYELTELCCIGEGGWSNDRAGRVHVRDTADARRITTGCFNSNDQYAGFAIEGDSIIYEPTEG